jgi:ABC-type antimicrobial peptide transport system permease subunit
MIIAVFFSVVIAVIAVGYQGLRAIRLNPVDSLRLE